MTTEVKNQAAKKKVEVASTSKEDFSIKLTNGMNRYYGYVVEGNRSQYLIAMRDFYHNIFPAMPEEIKNSKIGRLITERTMFFSIMPEQYLEQFSCFYQLLVEYQEELL